MKPLLIDTHCHFDPSDDIPALLAAARAEAVQVIAVGGGAALNATAQAAGVPFALGFDWSCTEAEAPAFEALPGMVAVGELGFDFSRGYSAAIAEHQHRLFVPQAELARAKGLPVIIHTREADDFTLARLREADLPKAGVIHSYTGSAELAKAFLDLGYCISFSGIVTFRNADALRSVAKVIPDDRILVETDCPYLTPVPLRGRRNTPAYVRYTADFLAALRGCSSAEFAERTTANARRLFSL